MTEYGDTAPIANHRPRRRRRGWTVLLTILVVLITILAVGDRVAAQYAARELRAQLVSELSNRGVEYGTTDVSIGGFPFLTQVAEGRYEQIDIDMTDVALPTDGGGPVTLPTLSVVAKGVDADTAEVLQGTAKVTAHQVTGTAIVSFATLENLVDYSRYNLSDVRFTESDGGLRVTGTASLAGVEVPISATAVVSVKDGHFRVRLRDAKAAVPIPPAAKDYLAGLVERSVTAQLPDLPFSLTVDHVAVDPQGLAVSATGEDVPLVT